MESVKETVERLLRQKEHHVYGATVARHKGLKVQSFLNHLRNIAKAGGELSQAAAREFHRVKTLEKSRRGRLKILEKNRTAVMEEFYRSELPSKSAGDLDRQVCVFPGPAILQTQQMEEDKLPKRPRGLDPEMEEDKLPKRPRGLDPEMEEDNSSPVQVPCCEKCITYDIHRTITATLEDEVKCEQGKAVKVQSSLC